MNGEIDIEDAARVYWDAIVVGTGMGGGAAGWRLASAGLSILFIEKGPAPQSSRDPEGYTENAAQRLEQGRWPTAHIVEIDGEAREIFTPLGCGVGGSTAIYGAALERLDRRDFTAGDAISDIGSSVTPARWPIGYDDIVPYYEEMERLFGVAGEADPLDADDSRTLKAPKPLGPRDAHFQSSFAASGLHPYRQHVAIDYVDGCIQCTGRLCPKNCKRTARNVFIEPAVEAGASLLADAEVDRFDSRDGIVDAVIVRRDNKNVRLKAAQFILAAGALFSPALLLKSANGDWPSGLGNANDMVGRRLMFHGDNRVAVWPRGKFNAAGPKKSLCFKDFYLVDGKKYGTVQAMGVDAGPGQLLEFLESSRRELGLPRLPLMRLAFKAIAKVAAKLFGPAKVFTGILEDLPYLENRIILDEKSPSGIRIVYFVHDELRARSREFRRMMREGLKPHRTVLIDRGVRLNLGHPAGTLAMGDDPATSALDTDNRLRGVDNLYVVDASFLPTSGGINPSLTVGANALRAADLILSRAAARMAHDQAGLHK